MAEAAEDKAPAKKATAKKTPAKKSTDKKAPAKKAGAAKKAMPKKRSTAKKTTVRKGPGKTPVKKKASVKTPSTKSAAAHIADTPTSEKVAAEANVTEEKSTAYHSTNDTKATSTGISNKTENDDQTEAHAGFDSEKLIAELKEKDWGTIVIRGLFMIFFGFLANLALMATFLLALVQFVMMVGSGKPNKMITSIISRLGKYIGQTLSFLSFKTEDKPFPIDLDLPEDE